MRHAVTFLTLFLVIQPSAAGQAVSGSLGSGGDEEAIREVLAGFVRAWNEHDARALSMVFAEDADFTNVAGKGARGRAEIEMFHASRFAMRFRETNLKITETKIRFIRPDVAAAASRWEMTGAKSTEGQDLPPRNGLLSFVMTRAGGEWLITVMHNSELPRPQKQKEAGSGG